MTVELEVNSGRLSRPVRLLLLEHLAVVQSLLLAVALPGSTGVVSTRNLVGSPLSLVSLQHDSHCPVLWRDPLFINSRL